MSESLFTEPVPDVRIAQPNDDKRMLIFGDPVAPECTLTLPRWDACKVGIGLVASATGQPVYSRSLLATIFAGAAMTVPPATVWVTVADGDRVYHATLYGVTETAVTVAVVREGEGDEGKEITWDVDPLQILRVSMQH